jgi:hypothetical protein
MSIINNIDLNSIKMLEDALNDTIKDALTEKLVKNELELYEIKLREMIKPVVYSLAIDGISNFKDFMSVRDELHVYIKWNDDNDIIEEKI